MTQKSGYTKADYIEDLKVMVKADREHLVTAVNNGDRVFAHQFADSVTSRTREIEDLTR